MQRLLALILAFSLLFASQVSAQIIRGSGGGTGSGVDSGATFPASPTADQLFFLTTATSIGDCTEGGGTARSLCFWNDDEDEWQPVNVLVEAQDLQAAFAVGKSITGANSLVNAVRIGDGVTPMCHYTDVTLGPVIRPCTDSNVRTLVPNGFTWSWYDLEAGAAAFTFDPDSPTTNGRYVFASGYKPLASFYVPLEADTGTTTMTLTNPVTGQPKAYWGTLTDSNSDGFSFHFPVTKRMEGATTMTVRLWGVSDAGSPSGNIVLHCNGKSYRPGTDTGEAHQTIGEQAVTLTPAVTNREVTGVSAAITIGGTIAENAIIIGACQVDATLTTSVQLTDFFLRGEALIQLLVNSLSD